MDKNILESNTVIITFLYDSILRHNLTSWIVNPNLIFSSSIEQKEIPRLLDEAYITQYQDMA